MVYVGILIWSNTDPTVRAFRNKDAADQWVKGQLQSVAADYGIDNEVEMCSDEESTCFFIDDFEETGYVYAVTGV